MLNEKVSSLSGDVKALSEKVAGVKNTVSGKIRL